MTAEIKFKRVERECEYNRTARKEGGRVLYDWNVTIDGEHRVIWMRDSVGHGYYLRDVGGEIVDNPNGFARRYGRRAAVVDKKELFEATIREMLRNGHIPTLLQIAAREAEQAEKHRKNEEQRAAARRLQTIEASGPDLLAALKEAVRLFETYGLVASGDGWSPTAAGKWSNDARAAIAKAEAEDNAG